VAKEIAVEGGARAGEPTSTRNARRRALAGGRCSAGRVKQGGFADALETIGARDNFGLDPGKQANERQREMFWRALHLEDLAIARGCALGRESAWRRFLAQYREQLTRAAMEMTGSAGVERRIGERALL